ncbi:hypothetical protein H4219_000275 [Mycoemilia scoparia]|uniref:Rab-GAP TBC domain-containing protein n=1 Tax=Mycoemilia scoparia TaxID=417184 RepID=A0A9W8AC59_9FUNG|nr:hypothetical protein H4219_000275 [Mycoemilia scoparia]
MTSYSSSSSRGSFTPRQTNTLEITSISRDEFLETLDSEVFVDVNKLREYARHGIPEEIRGDVWKFLLGTEKPNRFDEITMRKSRAEFYDAIDKENPETSKRVRGEVNRYFKRLGKKCPFDTRTTPATFESVICAYLNTNHAIEYSPRLVQMCTPFVLTMKKDFDVFSCFERLMSIMDAYALKMPINKRIAQFLTYFRIALPDLCSYFEEEEVDMNEWASSWLRYLLSRELPLPCILRLWDVYFSQPEFMDFHPYVCLAILNTMKETLEDLDQSEIRTQLLCLPEIDIPQIINQAFNFRSEISASYK